MLNMGWWLIPGKPAKGILLKTTHIGYIISNPAEVGLSKEEIAQKYNEYGEKTGQEGNARLELIKQAVDQYNWIRVRMYRPRGGERLTFNVKDLTERNANRIENFLLAYEGPKKTNPRGQEVGQFKQLGGPYTEVIIADSDGDIIFRSTIYDIVYNFALFKFLSPTSTVREWADSRSMTLEIIPESKMTEKHHQDILAEYEHRKSHSKMRFKDCHEVVQSVIEREGWK